MKKFFESLTVEQVALVTVVLIFLYNVMSRVAEHREEMYKTEVKIIETKARYEQK